MTSLQRISDTAPPVPNTSLGPDLKDKVLSFNQSDIEKTVTKLARVLKRLEIL